MRSEHAGGLSYGFPGSQEGLLRSAFLAGPLFTPWKQLHKDAFPPHSGEQPGFQSHRRLGPPVQGTDRTNLHRSSALLPSTFMRSLKASHNSLFDSNRFH